MTATEYPESAGGDVVGPTVFGHAGAPRRDRRRRGPLQQQPAQAGELLLARPGHPLLRPGRRRAPAPAIPPQTIAKPDLAATDCGAHHLLRPDFSRRSGASAAPPPRPRTPPRSPRWCRQANPGAAPRRSAPRWRATREPGRRLRPRRGRRRPDRRLRRASALGLPPEIAITKAPTSRSAATARRASSSAPTGRSPSPVDRRRQPPALRLALHSARARSPTASTGSRSAASTWPAASATAHRRLRDRHHAAAHLDPSSTRRSCCAPARRRARRGLPLPLRTRRGATFLCRVDRGPSASLRRPSSSSRFAVGRHVIRVRAGDRAGNVDPTPAVFRFRVEQIAGSAQGAVRPAWRRIAQCPPAAAPAAARRCRGRAGRSARGPRAGCRSRPRSR